MKKLYYHSKPTLNFPISPPLPCFSNLNEAKKWKPELDDELDEFNIARIDLNPRPNFNQNNFTQDEKDKADIKVIVCHDYAGGYKESHFDIGYSIQYWQYIDVFIYFSHQRIAIPPSQWTNAAHRNGVKVLGTFLTEHKNDLFENDLLVCGPNSNNYSGGGNGNGNNDSSRGIVSTYFVDKLVKMAEYYNFDGWFINIETELIGKSLHAKQIETFVNYLTEKMHQHKPGSIVIWYDSVIKDGRLKFQNRLNELNYPFFNAADGIFINYFWNEDYPKLSADKAEIRKRDVYTGIDVWGRSTFGGGGFTTYKALEVIKSSKTSCAIFAPGWTYENFGKDNFWKNDQRFWIGKADHKYAEENDDRASLPDEEKNNAVAHYIKPRYSPGLKNFYTNFDRGCGYKFFIKGREFLNQEWFHLSHQSILPSSTKPIINLFKSDDHSTLSKIFWNLSFEKAFSGGSSLALNIVKNNDSDTSNNSSLSVIPLYDLNLKILGLTKIKVTYSTEQPNMNIGLYVKIGGINNEDNDNIIQFDELDNDDDYSSIDDSYPSIILLNSNDGNSKDINVSDYKDFNNFTSSSSIINLQQQPSLQNHQQKEKSILLKSFKTNYNWVTTELIINPRKLFNNNNKADYYVKELGITFTNNNISGNGEDKNIVAAYIGELSAINVISNSMINAYKQVIQNIYILEKSLIVEKLESKNILLVSCMIKWELGIQTQKDYTINSGNDDKKLLDSFDYFYVYASSQPSIDSKPQSNNGVDDLIFLGVADTNKFIVSGYQLSLDEIIMKKDFILNFHVKGINNCNDEEEEGEDYKLFNKWKCWVDLELFIYN